MGDLVYFLQCNGYTEHTYTQVALFLTSNGTHSTCTDWWPCSYRPNRGKPEWAPHWSNSIPCDDICSYRTSFRKCPRVQIHWTASILLSVIQFRKCHHIQIIETASILHLQGSMCTLLVLLGQAESAKCSYSELSYVSAKLYRSSVDWRCIVQGATSRGPRQLRLCIYMQYATDIKQHVHTYGVGVADIVACEGSPHNVLHSSSGTHSTRTLVALFLTSNGTHSTQTHWWPCS